METKRDIKYLNKEFDGFRKDLINYTKTYFPNTYNDFSPASPGMAFMEMAAYVGDVLGFYLDNQFQETFLQFARQKNNIYDLAYMMNYKPKVTGVATVDVDLYQQVPSILSGSLYVPDYNYALYYSGNIGLTTTNTNKVPFLIEDPIDFSISNSLDPTLVEVYEVDGSNNPTYYLLKKTRKAISSTVKSTQVAVGNPERFFTCEINDANIIKVLDITDSNDNKWFETDYLANDVIYAPQKNTNINDPNNSPNAFDTPYLLKTAANINRRFVTRVEDTGSLKIQFGSGIASNQNEEIIPNPNNVGLGLSFGRDKLTTAFSPSNFLFTNTYGISPSNTTLTIRYLTGGGVEANIPSNTLNIVSSTPLFLNFGLNATVANYVVNSVSCNNPSAASGGQDGDTLEEIRQNAISNFPTQLRNVTQDDYLIRSLSMPSQYGVIAKAFIEPTKISNLLPGEIPSILDLYILSYNINKNLTNASTSLKQNLKTYLSQYRMINDAIRIKDAFIINIGVNFEIIVRPDYNNNLVLTKCIEELQSYFNIDKWQINQPIYLKEIEILLDKVDGVQLVKKLEIVNKSSTSLGYSQFAYDITNAIREKVIYPSIDPMIFEVKYPNTDILGKVSSI
jgi:hypothetical protein